MKFGILLFGSLLSSAAFSAKITSGKLNSEKTAIVLNVMYGGGCKEHTFKLEVGGCLESLPAQCSAKLVDLTTDDFCEAIISKEVQFPLAQYGLTDSYYSSASLTITGDQKTQVVLKLPEVKSSKPAKGKPAAGSNGSGKKSEQALVSGYKKYVQSGAATLNQAAVANDWATLRDTITGMKLTIEVLDDSSDLFSQKYYDLVCKDGGYWGCRNLVQSSEFVTKLYRIVRTNEDSELPNYSAEIKKLAKTILNISFQE